MKHGNLFDEPPDNGFVVGKYVDGYDIALMDLERDVVYQVLTADHTTEVFGFENHVLRSGRDGFCHQRSSPFTHFS